MGKFVLIDQLQTFRLWYIELQCCCAAFLYISAIYISITFAICGLSLLIQMITVNIHHVRPLRAVPKWIQTIHKCLPFHCASRKYQVDPETKEELQIDNQQPATSSQNTPGKLATKWPSLQTLPFSMKSVYGVKRSNPMKKTLHCLKNGKSWLITSTISFWFCL